MQSSSSCNIFSEIACLLHGFDVLTECTKSKAFRDRNELVIAEVYIELENAVQVLDSLYNIFQQICSDKALPDEERDIVNNICSKLRKAFLETCQVVANCPTTWDFVREEL